VHFPLRARTALLLALATLLLSSHGPALGQAAPWRSTLYPEDWRPGQADTEGRFLHDFSYAGYHRGEKPIPTDPPGRVYTVTEAPYLADPSGVEDATDAIQRAIDDAGAAGGGIVHLPAGTYRVTIRPGKRSALHIHDSGVVLRGEGPGTRIFNDDEVVRQKEIIRVSPGEGLLDWSRNEQDTRRITADLRDPATEIPVSDVSGYAVGDWIVLRSDVTPAFAAEHRMREDQWYTARQKGVMFYRRVTAVDPLEQRLTIHVPTRYVLKTRDNARVYKVAAHLSEVGIEHLAIGGRQNTTGGYGANDYSKEGTGAFEVHGSHAIQINHVVDGWVRGVRTFRPPGNAANVHLNSNGLILNMAAFLTVADCHFARPLYEGGGGNGYMYTLRSNESLIRDSIGEHSRHNFDFKSMWSSGNVILDSRGKDGSLATDFHMHLSPSNLFDNFVLDNENIEGRYRPYGTNNDHGQTTTQSVFWNTTAIDEGNRLTSEQWGWGYVIGTRGSAIRVDTPTGHGTAPKDHVEGVGEGERLEPRSLYVDQLERRLSNRPEPTAPSSPSPEPSMTPSSTPERTATPVPVLRLLLPIVKR
jgi:hypothetical protein